MQLLLGKPIADDILRSIKTRLATLSDSPGLGAILVGNDPASRLYVDLKKRAAQSIGMHFEQQALPVRATTADVIAAVRTFNIRSDIHGIIVQLPLPAGINVDEVICAIDPTKDADGFHPETVRRFLADDLSIPPVFPRAVRALIASAPIDLSGKRGMIYANSALFAQVMSHTLEHLGITIEMQCGTNTVSMAVAADIIITAKGIPHFLSGEVLQPGAIVIDGGVSQVDGHVVGDVNVASVAALAGYRSPVPGGVGPVTVAFLIARTVELALGEPLDQGYTKGI